MSLSEVKKNETVGMVASAAATPGLFRTAHSVEINPARKPTEATAAKSLSYVKLSARPTLNASNLFTPQVTEKILKMKLRLAIEYEKVVPNQREVYEKRLNLLGIMDEGRTAAQRGKN